MLEPLFNKVAGYKQTPKQVFSRETGKFLRTPFKTKHLWWLLLRDVLSNLLISKMKLFAFWLSGVNYFRKELDL